MNLSNVEKFYEEIKALEEKIPVKKRTPLHPYFTSQPFSLIREYISHYSAPNGKVLDLFGGSGTTLREGLFLGRQTYHVDILPWSCFLAEVSTFKPERIADLDVAYAKVKKTCEEKIQKLYKLNNKDAANLPDPKGFPSKVKLPKNADVETLGELFTQRNKKAIWILLSSIKKERDKDLRNFMLFIFSGILARATRTYWKDKNGKGGGDSGVYKVYRYWVPPEPNERNVWELFSSRVRRVAKLIRKDNRPLSAIAIEPQIICGSATDVTGEIGKCSIDYIFTDPPYAKHIAYLDLSTMYNALLGFKITDTMKKKEAIEGGDNAKSLDEYVNLIKDSFETAYQVLKFNRWMTVVFTHKDPNVFTKLIRAATDVGFEYVNAVPQDTKRPSFHKTNNSLTVLKGQMMLNFVKRRNAKAAIQRSFGQEAINLVIRSAQNTIVRNNGRATFSDIYHDMYEKLLANGYIRDFSKDDKSIEQILSSNFQTSIEDKVLIYSISNNFQIDELIPVEERLRLFILDYFNACEKENVVPTLDDIWANVIPYLKGKRIQPTRQAFLKILKDLANPVDEKYWIRATDNGQYNFAIDEQKRSNKNTLPDLKVFSRAAAREHDTFIYLLAMMGLNAGFQVHVGKKEQATGVVNGVRLKELSLSQVPSISKCDNYKKSLIEQIDLIWFDSEGTAIACFEVENSTKVEKTFDRIHALVGLFPQVKVENRCFIIAHEDNLKRLDNKLTKSHWVGYPYFMERCVSFFDFDSFLKFYRTLEIGEKLEAVQILARLNRAGEQVDLSVRELGKSLKLIK